VELNFIIIPFHFVKPHFLDADPFLLNGIEGLHPNRSEHEVFVNFEAVVTEPI
jgi:hypothetical protein